MSEAFICDAIRTPIGAFGGSLSSVRTDDLAAIPLKALKDRNKNIDWEQVDDLIYGCANQAGEDNRNVARMAGLLAGVPEAVAGTTINRLCASGLEAVGMAARALRAGDADFMLAGGVESMSRAPFVLSKSAQAFGRDVSFYDTTIGWRFVNREMHEKFGTDSMPQTADNVAAGFNISREDQDQFALCSQLRYAAAQAAGYFADEIVAVNVPGRKGALTVVDKDEHPRDGVTLDKLSALRGINSPDLSVTAGNASGVNDGACALVIANEAAVKRHALVPRARVVGMCSAGVEPRIMGIGPVPATQQVLERAGLTIEQMDIIELNEAFAAQSLAVLRQLGLPEDAEHINAQGGAIALGHPLGMSGARLVTTAVAQLVRRKAQYALCTLCVGVGQGTAMILERV